MISNNNNRPLTGRPLTFAEREVIFLDLLLAEAEGDQEAATHFQAMLAEDDQQGLIESINGNEATLTSC